jgi:hypothetical protein
MEYKSENRICQNCKGDFIIEPDDFNFYEKIKVPLPTFCPECRHQRRLSFRNENNFYKRNCDLCRDSVVSCYSPNKKYKVYCQKCWWSDNWDPESYSQDYDFSRPFFEQWRELFLHIPHVSLFNSNSVNSEWINDESDDKNCYLNVGGCYNEDSAYNAFELFGKNCFDNYWILNSDHCSNNIHGERNYFVNFSEECHDCLNVNFSYDCRNCNDCIGCAGLRNKKYNILNKQYTKEEYENFLKKHPFSSYTGLLWWKEESKKVWMDFPHRESMIFKAINSTGNNLSEVKNLKNCFQGTKLENCENLFIGGWMKDCYDCSNFGAAELTYESAHGGGTYNSKALLFCLSNDPLKKITINNAEYCAMSNSISNCFGCISIHGKEYMILNKRYSRESFDELRTKIIKHMIDMPYIDKKGRTYQYGDFFPSEFSPFGYNETTAMEYIKLEKEEAISKGFNWSDYISDIQYDFSDYKIPDDIKDVCDDILEKVLKCEETGKAYKIIPMELSFYRQVGLPIPRKCYKARHQERVSKLLPTKLFKRNCDKCKKEISTSYSPNRPEIIYCEKCYQTEIY